MIDRARRLPERFVDSTHRVRKVIKSPLERQKRNHRTSVERAHHEALNAYVFASGVTEAVIVMSAKLDADPALEFEGKSGFVDSDHFAFSFHFAPRNPQRMDRVITTEDDMRFSLFDLPLNPAPPLFASGRVRRVEGETTVNGTHLFVSHKEAGSGGMLSFEDFYRTRYHADAIKEGLTPITTAIEELSFATKLEIAVEFAQLQSLADIRRVESGLHLVS